MTTRTNIAVTVATQDDLPKMHHARKAKALRLAAAFEADYPALSLEAVVTDDVLEGWIVWCAVEEDEGLDNNRTELMAYGPGELPDLGDVLELCDEAGLDPEAGFEDPEPEASGSVVAEHYRQAYREASSNRQTCGDWLAEELTRLCFSFDTGFDVETFRDLLALNDVDLTRPWAKLYESGQQGWRGRYRMNGRQALEKPVALTGILKTAMGDVAVPADELQALRAKHEKWIAKEEKRQALADEMARVPSDEEDWATNLDDDSADATYPDNEKEGGE